MNKIIVFFIILVIFSVSSSASWTTENEEDEKVRYKGFSNTERKGPPSFFNTERKGPPSFFNTERKGPPSFFNTERKGPPSFFNTERKGPPSFFNTERKGPPSFFNTERKGTSIFSNNKKLNQLETVKDDINEVDAQSIEVAFIKDKHQTEKKSETINYLADFGYINVMRQSKGVEDIEINGDAIYMGTVGVTFFPGKYDLTLSYSTIVNASNDERKSQYIDINFNSIQTDYGTIGYGYHNHVYNSIIENKTGQNLYLDDVRDTTTNSAKIIANGDSYISQNYYERHSLSYLLPEMNYIPYGVGIKYSIENGSKAHPYKKDATGERYAYTDVEQEGTRIALGYYKTDIELKNGLSIKTLEVYQRDMDREYVIWYGATTPFSYTGRLSNPALGASTEIVYKSDIYRVGIHADYEEQTFSSRISDTEEYTTVIGIFGSIVY